MKTQYWVIELKSGWTGSTSANSPKEAMMYYKRSGAFDLTGRDSVLVVPNNNAHFYKV
jgi:hypothetical protein